MGSADVKEYFCHSVPLGPGQGIREMHKGLIEATKLGVFTLCSFSKGSQHSLGIIGSIGPKSCGNLWARERERRRSCVQSHLQKPSLSMQSSRRYMLGRYSKLFPSAASGEPVSLCPLFHGSKMSSSWQGTAVSQP